jgi:UDP-N-acetylmuramoyl-L-alanyl-D-glutamate--2,6-diaminopimelate ligase
VSRIVVNIGQVRDDLIDRGIPIVGTSLGGQGEFDEFVSVELTSCTHDSRLVTEGSLFCCVRGGHADGHHYAQSAVGAGARALLVEHPVETVPPVPQIVVDDVRSAMGVAAASVYGHPSASLTMIGVTGTNGKTSTAQMLAEILTVAGYRTEVIGTLTQTRTTPESTDLQARLAEFVAEGVTHVVMEVTSHALVLGRVTGVRYAVAVFTNLTQDHLDFHGTMEAYFRAKAMLFTPEFSDQAVVNADDPRGRLLFDAAAIPTTMFSMSQAEALRTGATSSFLLRGASIELPVGGRFSVSNALAAAQAATVLGIRDEAIASGLRRVVVPGRFETVETHQDFSVIVDYAHTPDGLIRVLESARDITPSGANLWCVFGCGGDRDRTKRPLMGRAAAELSDRLIVTSDNPRSEEPSSIVSDIVAGIPEDRTFIVRTELDRRRAIEIAILSAGPGDVVVIAGKGHEQGQDVNGVVTPFDDRVVAREVIEQRRADVELDQR